MDISLEVLADPAIYILSGNFWLDSFVKSQSFRGKFICPGKSGCDKFFCVIGLSGYQPYRNLLFLSPSHYSFGKLSHKSLAVGVSLAGDDEVGIFQKLIESYKVE